MQGTAVRGAKIGKIEVKRAGFGFLVGALFWAAIPSVFAADEGPFERLFAALSAQGQGDAFVPQGATLYHRVFSLESGATPEHYLRQILGVREIMVKDGFAAVAAAPGVVTSSDKIVNAVLRADLNRALRRSGVDRAARKKAVETFIAVLDLRGSKVKAGYSGLPFYSDFVDFFAKAENTRLAGKIAEIVEAESRAGAVAKLEGRAWSPRSFFAMVQEAMPSASAYDQVKMASFLLSRDVSLGNFLAKVPGIADSGADLLKVSLIPIHVRLLSELDRSVNGVAVDRVSFVDGLHSNIRKNYYFWSGSHLMNELNRRGVEPDVARRLVAEFPIAYKKMRYWQAQGKTVIPVVAAAIGGGMALLGKYTGMTSLFLSGGGVLIGGYAMGITLNTGQGAINYERFDRKLDAFQVSRLSAKGASFAETALVGNSVDPCASLLADAAALEKEL